MNIINIVNILRAFGAGGLVGALGRVVTAAEIADASLRRNPELCELRLALDDLRRVLRNR